MKKLIFLSLFLIVFSAAMFAAGAPRIVTQPIVLENEPANPDDILNYVTNASTVAQTNYICRATCDGTTIGTDLGTPLNYMNVYSSSGTAKARITQAAWPNNWTVGSSLVFDIWYTGTTPTGDGVAPYPLLQHSTATWVVVAGSTTTLPVMTVPPHFVVQADTWAYNLQVNGPADTAFTGPQNGTMPQLLAAPDTDEENELLGVYTAAAAPAGFHWLVNPITVTPADFTGSKAAHVYNGAITFVPVEDDTFTYNLYVNGPDGYAVTGPVAGQTDYLATRDNTAALIGDYTIAAAPAGFHWAVNPITVIADDFVLAGKTNFVYNKTIEFVLIEEDTWTYNLNVTVNDAVLPTPTGVYTVNAVTTPYTFTDGPGDVANTLPGAYTIEAAPAGYHWAVNPITVLAEDFVSGTKANYVYNAAIVFELVADPAPLVITPVDPATVPAGYPMPEGTAPTAAYIVTWSGIHDLFIARGMNDTNAYAYIGGAWLAPNGTSDWTWLAVNFDAKAPIPVIILGPDANFQLLVESHELGIPSPDINAEILLNGVSFPTQIYTPYTFGISGNYTWVPGTYSVVKAGYASWIPDSITFVDITADYAVDFQGIPDGPTPVELSSFTATLTAETYVQLTWISQTEAQMMGYLVYRNTTPDQSTSVLIDHPMVPATNTSSTQTYSAIDNDVTIGTTYYYWLEAVDYTNSTYHGPVSVTVNGNVPPVLPEVTSMRNAYPNPFNANGRTNIEVSLKGGENGTVTIYNVLGQVVRTFNVTEGNHMINWNGRDAKGNNCGSGIYFYKLSTPSMNVTKKMVIVK